MKLKDQLVLRKVAGQYVIVPTGKRVREVTAVVYLSASAAYLWEYMKEREFTQDDLVAQILEHFNGVTKEDATVDVEAFLQNLADNNLLEGATVQGRSFVPAPKELLEKLWPPEAKGGGSP